MRARRALVRHAVWILVAVLGCSLGCSNSEKKKTDEPEEDLRYTDQDGQGAIPTLGRAAAQQATTASQQGPVATIVYVTTIGKDEVKRPGAVIFSSDPDSSFMAERPRPSRILKACDRPKMGRILAALDAAGLASLRPIEQKQDERIDGVHQFIILKDGKRVAYREDAVENDLNALKQFRKCEKVLVDYTHANDPVVATQRADVATQRTLGK